MLRTVFVPMLVIGNGVADISFYTKAFGATELRRWSNDDGSIHVAELEINGAMFHLHEASSKPGSLNPAQVKGSTVTIGLMTKDADMMMANALATGAKEISPMQSYDYSYRQGEVEDPFGHHWLIEKMI